MLIKPEKYFKNLNFKIKQVFVRNKLNIYLSNVESVKNFRNMSV